MVAIEALHDEGGSTAYLSKHFVLRVVLYFGVVALKEGGRMQEWVLDRCALLRCGWAVWLLRRAKSGWARAGKGGG